MESDYSLRNVYENCQFIPNLKNIPQFYAFPECNIPHPLHNVLVEILCETTPMNQKELPQAKQKGETAQL